MKGTIGAVVIVVAAAVAAWYAWQLGGAEAPRSAGSAGGQAAAPVTLQGVVLEREITRIDAVGTARASRSVTLYPASAGEVVAVDFEPNQQVSAGDRLLALDARDERLALELAEVRLADARRTLSRYTRAEGSGAFTPTETDAARTAAEEARIARDRAAVALDDRTVEAPFDGVVGLSDVDPGDRIGTDTPITTVDDRSALLVRFDVPEAFLGELRAGDSITLAPWNGNRPPATARIADVDSRIDPQTRTFTARARLPNPDDLWRPGMSFRVVLELAGPLYAQIPELSLQWGGDGAYVWAIGENSRAQRVPVNLVQRQQGSILVDAELGEGHRVVVEGVQSMREGRLVEVLEPDSLRREEAVGALLEPSR